MANWVNVMAIFPEPLLTRQEAFWEKIARRLAMKRISFTR
jgi:hypothetical protein